MNEHPATGDWPGPSESPSAEWPILPGFEILAELGRGGMGIVYRARQVNMQRLVALKLLRDGALAGPQERARFRIEAEAAARMNHPHIVSIHEVGEHQGRLYYAMELIEGGSLDKHLAGQPRPAAQAAALVHTLALAVQHAHAQKVIHRDLKPGNILLSDDGSPKITDFGLAKRLDSDSTAWTREGAVLGTASYMAPEQAAGRVGAIGPAADVYALGAILYELLTGQPPFQAETWHQTLQQVLNDEPVSPAKRRDEVPADLDTVCLKCLEKEPSRRYASAAELADDLGRFGAGKRVVAVPVDAQERLTRLAARDDLHLVGILGRGPLSTVYQARYGPLRQPVAVKVFAAAACTRENWEARLQRDAQLRAALAHPHIVPIQQVGWWDDSPYLVQELVPQGSLAARIAGKPLPVRQAVRLAEQLAQIIRYLHRQGVVHGNLKPSNVLLAVDDIPRIVDLHPTGGLFLGSLNADNSEFVHLGYLAPEALGDRNAEPRMYTDIYGLGLILYEMLTGSPPFNGATAAEMSYQVQEQGPLPPSRLNPEVMPPLDAFCLRCLRKDPWRRYTRAYDLLMRLRSLLDCAEDKAAPDERWPRRRPNPDPRP